MEIKPCPFCASRNLVVRMGGSAPPNLVYMVVCNDCDAEGPPATEEEHDGTPDDAIRVIEAGKKLAFTLWNLRIRV